MPEWLWVVLFVISNGALLWSAHIRYRFGIADGAFNQSLPHVQQAMLDYDRERALTVLNDKGIPLYVEDRAA